MTTTLADLPDAARKMLAYFATLDILGFASSQIKMTAFLSVPPGLKPLPPGHVALAIRLERGDDDDQRRPPFDMIAGYALAEWWSRMGPASCMEAWNALTRDERAAERMRGMPVIEMSILVGQLLAAGFRPPMLTGHRIIGICDGCGRSEHEGRCPS